MACECGSDADVLLRMGPVSKPCRGRFSALTNRLRKSGLVTIGWLSMKEYVLQRTAAGNSVAKALFRQRGEQIDCPTCLPLGHTYVEPHPLAYEVGDSCSFGSYPGSVEWCGQPRAAHSSR